ncbi:MAG: DUF1361 domain-containing protein [Tepidiformaceae bacterium]
MGRVRPSTFGVVALLLVLSFCSLGCLALISLREHITGSFEYTFMRWNLVLAWLPMSFALITLGAYRRRLPPVVWMLSGVLWLLFLPNAPYLVTDFIHLRNSWASAPLWFDVVMFASFGVTGLGLGYASLYFVHGVFSERFGTLAGWGLILTVFALSSIGIYLGRILRLNSWDAFTRPDILARIVRHRLDDPFRNPEVFPLLAGMTILLLLGYALFVASTLRARHIVGRPERDGFGR